MARRIRPLLALAVCGLLAASEPSPAGLLLARRYDAMDVEHHWLRGRRIDWRTGDPLGGKAGGTHCSAFAAAACARFGIYLLRPPEHRQGNLANAQALWLEGAGTAAGWSSVPDPEAAQRLANEGQVVVAVYLSPDPGRSGHIALVRPSDKAEALLRTEGPQIIQAGGSNHASASMKTGFRRHKGAWIDADHQRIRFFAHAGPGPAAPGPAAPGPAAPGPAAPEPAAPQ